jgi:hypothetical protein
MLALSADLVKDWGGGRWVLLLSAAEPGPGLWAQRAHAIEQPLC